MQGQTLKAAAAATGMSERSGSTWQDGPAPSTTITTRTWRTRTDPFAGVWATEIEPYLRSDEDGELLATKLIKRERVDRWSTASGQARAGAPWHPWPVRRSSELRELSWSSIRDGDGGRELSLGRPSGAQATVAVPSGSALCSSYSLCEDRTSLTYSFDVQSDQTSIAELLAVGGPQPGAVPRVRYDAGMRILLVGAPSSRR